MPRDLRKAATTMGDEEVRYLVDLYYQMQENRKGSANQVRALQAEGHEEPHETLAFFASQETQLEDQIRGALDSYSAGHKLGAWSREIVGIGPVIAAGLLVHVDIQYNKTVGKIWRFWGLDPTVKWEKGQKRPWNARAKVLYWKLGDSFVKQKGRENAFYGHMYEKRKLYELERDVSGGNAETAARTLQERNIKDPPTRKIYESGHLPPGRLDQRARRWAVKLFLSHYLEAGHRLKFGEPGPAIYSLAHLGHVDYIPPPIPWPEP